MSCLLNFLRGPRKNQPQMMEKGEPRRRHHRKTIDSFACRGVSSQVQYAEESTSAKGRSNGKQRSSELPGSFPKSDSERLSELPGSFPKKTNEVPSAVADKHDGRETIYLSLEPPPPVDYDRKPTWVPQPTPFEAKVPSTGLVVEEPAASQPPPLPQRRLGWSINSENWEEAPKLCKKLHQVLRNASDDFLQDTVVFALVCKTSHEQQIAQRTWDLLTGGQSTIRRSHLTMDFCAYFLHIFSGVFFEAKTMPRYIPVKVRASYDQYGRYARDRLGRVNAGKSFLDCFVKIRNDLDQGRIFVPFLEFILESGRPADACSYVSQLVKKQGKFEGFRLLGTEELSNLLATLLREHPKDPVTQKYALELFEKIFHLSARTAVDVFPSVTSKGDHRAAAICLGLFLAVEGLAPDEQEALWSGFLAHHSWQLGAAFTSLIELLLDLRLDSPLLPHIMYYMDNAFEVKWKEAWCETKLDKEYETRQIVTHHVVDRQKELVQWYAIR